jgi:hypothetical protein
MSSRPSTHACVARSLSAARFAVVVTLAVAAAASPARSASSSAPLPIVGRWDVTVSGPGYEYPAWFEILEDSSGLAMRFAGRFGAPAPVPYVTWDGSHVEFRFASAHRWRGTFNGRWFTGTTGGEDETWLAVRAPKLLPPKVRWGKPRPVFDGRTLAGWRPRNAGSDHGWCVRDGALTNAFPGDDLVSLQTFTNFKLSLRFRLQPGSDSGVHLRGRYEVQLTDHTDQDGAVGVTGAIYGRLPPSPIFSCAAGRWHRLEATLIGREVSLVLDDVTVLDRATIDGITGGALDSREGAAGPIMLQGTLGAVEFRDLVVTPAL